MAYDCGVCGTVTKVRVIGGDVVCDECGSVVTITEAEMEEHLRLLRDVYGPKVGELMQSKDKIASIVQYVNTLDSMNAFLFGMAYFNFCDSGIGTDGLDIVDLGNGMGIGVISAESPEKAIEELLRRMFGHQSR